jgi:predicted GTPase
MEPTRVLIMGAAGRDFHNFNAVFRGDESYQVACFTATQIPNIEKRRYPPELAGSLYPDGIPIFPEADLERLIREFEVDQVVFSYSDISHLDVMHKASRALAAGAGFRLLGPEETQLHAGKPMVSVCAVRTGSGKSQTTRHVVDVLRDMGHQVVVIRHPMPYGNLVEQTWQRFATYEDLDRQHCTIEEREEYEPHLDRHVIVYAGVDYGEILSRAQEEADILVWDGGNNDLPFYRSDLAIVVADPHRPGHELSYHPGEANLRMADVVVVNKVDTAGFADISTVRENTRHANPGAVIVEAASPILVENPKEIAGASVLVVEDGPTLTHGEMAFGAGAVAARRYGAAELVDPRPYAVGSIKQAFAHYPHIGPLLPAMGYGKEQIEELAETINKTPADLVLIGTPIDLRRVMDIHRPTDRVRYELEVIGEPTLRSLLEERFSR